MREKKYFCNTMLTVILGVALLINAVVHAFAPAVVLPDLNIPNIVPVSYTHLGSSYQCGKQ